MAPRKKYGYTVVVFDANSSPEFKENAIQCYKKINEIKFLEGSNDDTKLYFANAIKNEGTSKTNCYPVTNTAFFHPLNHLKMQNAEGIKGNLLEGIEMAVNDLNSCHEEDLYWSYQLVVFSDLKTKHDIEPSKAEKMKESIVNTLNEMNAYVYFFGVSLQINGLFETKRCVYDYMQSAEYDESDLNLEEIAQETYGVVCPFELATDLFFTYSLSKRGTPFLEPMDINGVEIPTASVKYLDKQPLKRPRKADPDPVDKTFVLADQQDEVVDFSDVQSGMALHGKFVFIPTDVNKGLQNYPRFFKLLGFTDSKNVPEHIMLPDMNLITVNGNTDPTVGYVNYLIEAAEKYNKYGIALKTHIKGCRPKLFCLIPKTSPHHFIMKELPYAEDFQILYNESKARPVKDNKIGDEHKKEVFDFLDSVDLDDKLKLHPFMRVKDSTKRQASLLGVKAADREIVHEDEEVMGLRFDDPDIRAKLNAIPVIVKSEATVDDVDPW